MRCYFHLVDQHETILDDMGVEVPDLETAHRLALKAIRELRDEDGGAVADWQGWQLNAVDQDGNTLFSIPLDRPLN